MIRSILISITALFLIYGCTSKESIAPPDIEKDVVRYEDLLWVFKPNVNIRESASGSAKKISGLVDGDSVIVLSNVNGWYQIRTVEGKSGWIRSDLLGPKDLSAFNAAVTFIEDLKENQDIEVYFDKKLYHKRIYVSYPSDIYSSRQEVESKTRELVKEYQNMVYRGHVTARVLKPGTDEEYLTLDINGAINAEPILPIIPFGKIETVNRDTPSGIQLVYSIPDDISDQQLLSTARQLVPKFPISYQHVEITFKNSPYSVGGPCRLWYIEDKNGEDYKLNQCK